MLSEQDKEHTHYFSIINSEIIRMNSIIQEFLILSKPHEANLKIHNIRGLAHEVILLFQSEAHYRNVDIKYSYDEDLLPVMCEGNALKQVFINLMKNSLEAMPAGGQIRFHINNGNGKVVIAIEDDGMGMPEHILKDAGKPFFTTKDDGTGLGLMISERIIHQHKGALSITSHVNSGTRIEITLPAAHMESV